MIGRLRMAWNGAIAGWSGIEDSQLRLIPTQSDYEENWQLYDGTAFTHMLRRNPYRNSTAIYKNTKLLWKMVEAIADFYASTVYQGALTTTPPADGSALDGAIPFVAQTGDDGRNRELLTAITELFIAWNWQQQMSQRPLYSAVLKNVLTELVDDRERGFLYPQTIWPGYVTAIDLDYVDNVQAYTLEYRVNAKRSDGTVDSYMFRKEVDKEAFRYFRNDAPHPDYGNGTGVVPNEYGFVPAIWDRHRKGAPGSVYGRSAIDGTKQALMQVNSIFSHAFDFQRKTFFSPIMVSGGSEASSTRTSTADMTSMDDPAEEFKIVKVGPGSQILQAQFDVGKTLEMLKEIQQGILDENPEARFYAQLRNMAQVATTTAEMLMGDVASRVQLVRGSADIQTVKLFQMAIAMAGHCVNSGVWGMDGVKMSRRQLAFSPFSLDSYRDGMLDMMIASRGLVPMTDTERVQLVRQKEAIQTAWGYSEIGVDSDTAREILDQRAESQWRLVNGGSYADLLGDAGLTDDETA